MAIEYRMRGEISWEEMDVISSGIGNLENRGLRFCGHIERMKDWLF
jgi:hypothetical protein